MKIEDFHNISSGQVGLLGNGPTLAAWDLPAFYKEMPLIGINRSWELLETRWRCYVDGAHHKEILDGKAPDGDIVFFPAAPAEIEHWISYLGKRRGGIVGVPHTPITQETPKRHFCGAELDRGSFAPFAGYFALELAHWMGFNPIYLFGFDGTGGHFDVPEYERPAQETRQWNELFREARTCLDAAGVRVINLNPDSAIDAFDFLVDTGAESGMLDPI